MSNGESLVGMLLVGNSKKQHTFAQTYHNTRKYNHLSMEIACIQLDIRWNSPEENIRRLTDFIRADKGADLYVLPEMWNTGFTTATMAETEDGPSLTWMRQTALHRRCALAGSMAVNDGGRLFNRFYFVHPDGHADHYDKHHLFTHGQEHLRFTPGEHRVVVAYKGVRFLLQVCYDLRFPVFSRNRGDYDAILYVASWPAVRIDAWEKLLCARAIENQCYVIGVNRTGHDAACVYCGATMCFDAYGHQIAASPHDTEHLLPVTLDMESLHAFRQKFPVLPDGDLWGTK